MDWATVSTGVVALAGILGVSRNAAGQRKVELARIGADDRRRAEDRRRERLLARQEAYARYIVALDVLDTYGGGYVPSDDEFKAALHEYNGAESILTLIAPVEVREAVQGVATIYHEISARMGHYAGLGPGPPDAPLLTRGQQHEGAYLERRGDMLQAVEALKEAMRDDLIAAEGGISVRMEDILPGDEASRGGTA